MSSQPTDLNVAPAKAVESGLAARAVRRGATMAIAGLAIFGLAVSAPVESGASIGARTAPQAAQAPSMVNLRLFPAMAAAGSVIGHPYRWGGAAPGGFDCSGLVRWSFAQAGIDLPHSSRAQRNATMHISESELLPGDLVFYGSPVYHVGIYVGGGQIIHAPRSGDVVKYAPIHRGVTPSSFGRVK